MAFDEVLQKILKGRTPNLLDMHKAFSVVATLYIEDALNLVAQSTLAATKSEEVLAQADMLFSAWTDEIASVKSAILRVNQRK